MVLMNGSEQPCSRTTGEVKIVFNVAALIISDISFLGFCKSEKI